MALSTDPSQLPRVLADQFRMFLILCRECLAVCQLEVGEIETRSDCTAYQCIFACRCGRRCEPAACFHDRLKGFSFVRIGSKDMGKQPAIVADLIDVQRVAIIEMP